MEGAVSGCLRRNCDIQKQLLTDNCGRTQRTRIFAKVSDFINSIARDQSIAFQNESNQNREKIYISYDSTNKSCQTWRP